SRIDGRDTAGHQRNGRNVQRMQGAQRHDVAGGADGREQAEDGRVEQQLRSVRKRDVELLRGTLAHRPILDGAASPVDVHLPMAIRWRCDRTYHVPSTRAGDASTGSPSRLTCSSLNSRPASSTNV